MRIEAEIEVTFAGLADAVLHLCVSRLPVPSKLLLDGSLKSSPERTGTSPPECLYLLDRLLHLPKRVVRVFIT